MLALVELACAFRDALVAFDPALVTGDDAAGIVEELARTEKACAAARARSALRASECRAHEKEGYADASDWLARSSGSSLAEARGALEVAAAAKSLPATAEAMTAGDLSIAQAQVITRTTTHCPGAEAEMLLVARDNAMSALIDEGRRRRLAAADVDELHRRQWRARELRHWRDDTGMVRLAGALPPEVGVAMVNRLDAEADRIRRSARRDADHEPRAAHVADALVSLLSNQVNKRSNTAEVVVVCDLRAYRRGHAHDDETCHIVGGGPLPVSVAREMSNDAFLKAVLHDGTRIDTVAHLGRHIPAELRTALELGPPPNFEGVNCTEAGCGRRHGLEWDHVDPVANGGPTSYDNLQPRCWPHHRAKTDRDRQAGLLGGGSGARAP